MARRKQRVALNDGHTLHLMDEFHPDPRIAAVAADKASQAFAAKLKEAKKHENRAD